MTPCREFFFCCEQRWTPAVHLPCPWPCPACPVPCPCPLPPAPCLLPRCPPAPPGRGQGAGGRGQGAGGRGQGAGGRGQGRGQGGGRGKGAAWAALPCPALPACPALPCPVLARRVALTGREVPGCLFVACFSKERPAQAARTHNPTPTHLSCALL